MKRLWLYWLPLLFLPNLGVQLSTPVGTLGLADFLIFPYLVLVLLGADLKGRRKVAQLKPLAGFFVLWALLSTATIPFRYDYADMFYLQLGISKLAKFLLYGVAGLLTASALTDDKTRKQFHWSLLVSVVVMSFFMIMLGSGEGDFGAAPETIARRYESANIVSVVLAILLCYLSAKLLTGYGSDTWRRYAVGGIAIMVIALAVSDGRGGWLAAIAGLTYLAARLGPSRQVMLGILSAVVFIVIGYAQIPEFRVQIDRTFFGVDQLGYYEGVRTVANIDDGARINTWLAEIPKIADSPVFGTGFYHRGEQTSLYATGSHSFFIQMFLELGIVGGGLVIVLFVRLWRDASRAGGLETGLDLSLKVALLAVIVGAMSESVLYGGIVLFILFLVYADMGSRLPRSPHSHLAGIEDSTQPRIWPSTA